MRLIVFLIFVVLLLCWDDSCTRFYPRLIQESYANIGTKKILWLRLSLLMLVDVRLSSNVLPRANSLNEVCHTDVYLVDKMLHGLQGIEGVPFASMVISHIRSIVRSKRWVKSFCFQVMLAKVFEFFAVDMMEEDINTPRAVDVITKMTLY
ncbi:hypothetical protein FNV43_RR27352 [Rhamnella rubrinervis]|uniref:Uncharacterized protein n=1 Tax=Rhamnella rubrinervis TaxID=2594499 RepID=A0A8K0GKI5_9ROSA|nr:hypothetical protein FNV43_RR27352 [Rhamnella rubrinervis]